MSSSESFSDILEILDEMSDDEFELLLVVAQDEEETRIRPTTGYRGSVRAHRLAISCEAKRT